MSEITKEEFSKIYNERFVPVLREIEPERAAAYKKIQTLGFLALGGIAFALLDFFFQKGYFFLIGTLIAAPCIICAFLLSKQIRIRLKKEVVSKILSLFGNLYFSENKDVVSYKDIKLMGLFPRFTTKTDDDIIIGIYQGLNFVIDECKLTHTEKHGKSTVTVTDFGGLLVKIQMKKNFSGKTVVGLKGYIQKMSGYDEVQLEDVEFMRYKHVYSTDQIEARYILTTAFMERLRCLGENFIKERVSAEDEFADKDALIVSSGKSIDNVNKDQGIWGNLVRNFLNSSMGVSAAFIEGYAYLFIPSGEDFFEVRIEDSLLNEAKYYHIYRELQSILAVVEYLKLNSNLGL